MKKTKYYIITFCWVLLVFACQVETRVSYNEVIERMTDLKMLSKLPEKGEKSGMFSSYDRRSKYDSISNRYIDWDANNDGLRPQYIRKEGDNMVLAEMKGPGAIVRVWSASPAKGHIKIYIDGNEVPVIDLPFIDYFNTESVPAFNYPNMVYETNARGFNNYIPITFQDSIKIVGEPGWGQYYHFNYISFPEGTIVEEFNPNPSDDIKQKLRDTDNILGLKSELATGNHAQQKVKKEKLLVKPGNKNTLLEINGKKAITGIKIKFNNLPKEKTAEVYRKTIFTINWDNETEPSIWSPVGDFFGSAPGHNTYKTLPTGMTDDAMFCRWYMPFSKNAVISMQNFSDIPVEIEIELTYEKLKGNSNNYGYFHAKWHRDIMPVEDERWPDWTVLKTNGKGRFVGMFLSVWNPKGGSCREFAKEGQHWWGEGDEKIFVDGEKFPSTFGTGTEDYFGYAWCIPKLFEHAFHSQNYTEQNMGYQSLNRWQIIDNIPFQESLEVYMEKYFPNKWPTQYATVAYWYLQKGGDDPIEPTPANELFGYETPYKVFIREGAVEAENFKITKNTGGWCNPNAFANETMFDQVSGHRMMIWFANNKTENQLKATFDLSQQGTYKVYANIVLNNQGGNFDISLNDKNLINNISFHSKQKSPGTKKLFLGTINIVEGQQEISFQKSKNTIKGNRLALDYLYFEKIR